MPEETKSAAAPKAEITPSVTITPPPAPTAEEIQKEADEFIASNFGVGPAAKPKPAKEEEEEEAPPAEETPAAEDQTEETPAAETQKPEEEKKKRFVPGQKKASIEEIEAIARRVTQEEREADQAAEEVLPAPAKSEQSNEEYLSDEDRDQLEILAELEANVPAQKGIVAKQKQFLKKAADYRNQYETKNGVGTFNATDPEHNEFYRKNQPFISAKDFKAADRSIIARDAAARACGEMRKEYDPQFRELKAAEKQRAVQSTIAKSIEDAVEDVFTTVPEFKALITPGKLTEEAVAKMGEINPVIHHYVSEEAELAMAVAEEAEKLMRLSEHYQFDPNKAVTLSSGKVIYPHADLGRAFQELEARLAQAPKDERMDKGKDFITTADRWSRLESINRSNLSPEQKKRKAAEIDSAYYVVTAKDVKKYVLNQSKLRVATIAKKFGHLSKSAPEVAVAKNGHTQTEQPPKQTAKAGLTKGTSTTSVSDRTDNTPKTGKGVKNESELFVESAFS